MNQVITSKVKDQFHSQLSSYSGSKFEVLRQFSQSLQDNNKVNSENISMDKRLEDKLYFMFPHEADESVMLNCFEKSAAVYYAMQLLAPEFNPKLVFLDEGDRGTHATTLFTYDGKLHIADPNYNFFNPGIITRDSIFVRGENDDEENGVKFEIMDHIGDDKLEQRVSTLREPSGIMDFFKGAGQMVSEEKEGLFPYSIFFYENKEGKTVSETRQTNMSFAHHDFYRYTLDFEERKAIFEFGLFKSINWRSLNGEVTLMRSEPTPFKQRAKQVRTITQKQLGKRVTNKLFLYSLYLSNLNAKRKKGKTSYDSTYLDNRKTLMEYRDDIINTPEREKSFENISSVSESIWLHFLDSNRFRDVMLNRFKREGNSLDSMRIKNFKRVRDLVDSYGYFLFSKNHSAIRKYTRKVSDEMEKFI